MKRFSFLVPMVLFALAAFCVVPSQAANKNKKPQDLPTTTNSPKPTRTPVPTPVPSKNIKTTVPEKSKGPHQTPTPFKLGDKLSSKIVSNPQPKLPDAARVAKASGPVKVQLTVDENGRVVSAKAISGNPLLQKAAEESARNARFSPTKLSGQPVKVTGVIQYNFVAQ
jgi:periplasmic protein TonB